jgi:Tyrosyl-DNA phosphodiesterase
MSAPNWREVLPTPPKGGRLAEAWMTSFEKPDADLLVEHFLPSLLGMSQSLSDAENRSMFFGELCTTLERLRGKITVISSPPRGESKHSSYSWLWRYVYSCMVGKQKKAIQHAKLWAFHWKVEDKDELELYVSSTNLTSSAFKDQLQAGWTQRLQLADNVSPSISKANTDTWGQLIPFLASLGESAGQHAKNAIERLSELLGRAACPNGVTFLASIPGEKGSAHQLAALKPKAIHVMTPTIGDWNEGLLNAWCVDAGIKPKNIHLKWIEKSHRWAQQAGWSMSGKVYECIHKAGVQVESMPDKESSSEYPFAKDSRWSHAKLYLIQAGKKNSLLVTSANWSASAWGSGDVRPKNYELGVLVDTEWTALGELKNTNFNPFCIDREEEDSDDSAIYWAEACWDGQKIQLHARSACEATAVEIVVSSEHQYEMTRACSDEVASLPWNEENGIPVTAQFKQGIHQLTVNVVDLRTLTDFSKTPLPEVDPKVQQALRDKLLLERYGGPVVDSEASFQRVIPQDKASVRVGSPATDYSVSAWTDARDGFGVVDQWQKAYEEAMSVPHQKEHLQHDCERLKEIFQKCEGVANKLVAQEIDWRLKGVCNG